MKTDLLKIDTVYVIQQAKLNGQHSAISLTDLMPLFQTLLWVSLIVCALIFFRREVVMLRIAIASRLESGGGIEIGFLKLEEKVLTIQDKLAVTNDRISRLFITAMSLDMYRNLKKLSSGSFGKFQKSKGLVRELYYLRDVGYIEVPSITSIPESGDELSLYITVTAIGREFIKLREDVVN